MSSSVALESQTDANEVRKCNRCSKVFSRRDLLVRHLRGCEPNRVISKRKACISGVTSKIKCSYTRPRCLHCTKRDVTCEYYTTTTGRERPGRQNQRNNVDDMGETARLSRENTNAADTEDWPSIPSFIEGELDLDFQWEPVLPPTALGSFHLASQGVPSLSLPSITSGTKSIPENEPDGQHAISGVNPPLSRINSSTAVEVGVENTPVSMEPCMDIPSSLATFSDLQQSISGAGFDIIHTPNAAEKDCETVSLPLADRPGNIPLAAAIVSVLQQYPQTLLNERFRSQFLHPELSQDVSADMTALPNTSMAICCGGGLESKDGRSYVRRAVSTNRNSLAKLFPKYACMDQWDAVHASCIYELLELENSLSPNADAWKLTSKPQGLKMPFLVKMSRRFCESHPEVAPRNTSPRNDAHSRSLSWNAWAVAESSRRLIFLSNLVNFFGNRNLTTNKQSMYYESLDNDLILNMQLPCSNAVWEARSEEQWLKEVQSFDSINNQFNSNFTGDRVETGQTTLRTLLSTNTKQQLQWTFGGSYGFSDSDGLRSLVVLGALEQFM